MILIKIVWLILKKFFLFFSNPLKEDSDSDNISDYQEAINYFTNPLKPDSDSDGMPDYWEIISNLSLLIFNSQEDSDSDKLTNFDEYFYGTNPNMIDTDNDGYSDFTEISKGTNPSNQYNYPIRDYTKVKLSISLVLLLVSLLGSKTIYILKKEQ